MTSTHTAHTATPLSHTLTSYDDPAASRRRWGHLEPHELEDAARCDPLRFIADHIPIADRHRGAVALYGDLGRYLDPVLVVVPDGPFDPPAEECAMLLDNFVRFVAMAGEQVGVNDFGIGIVHHRTGNTAVNDLDRRWLTVLEAAARVFTFSALGAMARTEAGALVPIALNDD